MVGDPRPGGSISLWVPLSTFKYNERICHIFNHKAYIIYYNGFLYIFLFLFFHCARNNNPRSSTTNARCSGRKDKLLNLRAAVQVSRPVRLYIRRNRLQGEQDTPAREMMLCILTWTKIRVNNVFT